MLIERVQIEGGFLNGLDIRLVAGLNVLIGARGTGKTSFIELIRFALGAPAFTDEAARRGAQQALSVLQDGEVTLTLVHDGERQTVSRSGRDNSPRSDRPIPSVIVLAQNEVEAVGAQPMGRLRLIDRFRDDRTKAEREGVALVSTLRSLTAEVAGVRDEFLALSSQIHEMRSVRQERREALAEQQEVLRSIAATQQDQQRLAALQVRATELGLRATVFDRTASSIATTHSTLTRFVDQIPEIEEWPEGAGPNDMLEGIREVRAEVLDLLLPAISRLDEAKGVLRQLDQENANRRTVVDSEARAARQDLERLQTGAGALTQKVDELTEREAQLVALENLAAERATRIEKLQIERRSSFEDLERLRSKRFQDRRNVADHLANLLSPEIRVRLVESGITGRYSNAIVSALRGSGLHYNTLAPLIAKRMSPLELVEAAESRNATVIAQAAEIPDERAANIVASIPSESLADLVAAPIDDAVELSLLDGSDYKPSEQLSIGQRCTVVLPILFSGHGEPLIVDQPEDHLDNAFITETLVERIRGRGTTDQFILASHNANIPVLGEADQVIRLDSDGRRGFVAHAGALDDPATVRAITSVMEGGVEAFERRAAFYRRILGDDVGA